MVFVFLTTLRGSTVCLSGFEGAEAMGQSTVTREERALLLRRASEAEGIPQENLRISVQRSNEGNALHVHTLMRLAGGKQGAFGQTLKHTKMIRKTTNFDSCRTLDGRRVREVRQEERLRQWQESKKKRELERAEEAERKREERGRAIRERVDDLIEKVERDSATTMADAVMEGLALARQEKRKRKKELELEEEERPAKRNKIDWDNELLLGFDEEEEEEEEEENKEECDYEEEEEEENEIFLNKRKETIKTKHEHEMKKIKNPYGPEATWECDGCGKNGKSEVMHCSECGYDLCTECYSYSIQSGIK